MRPTADPRRPRRPAPASVPDRPLDPATVVDLADGLCDPAHAGDDGSLDGLVPSALAQGALIHLAPSPEPGQVEVGVLPLLGDHPLSHLLGVTAPRWLAVGVRVHGRARHLDDPLGEPTGVTSTLAVTCDGRVASRLRWPGGAVDEPDAAPEGLVVDACRRVLGLATPPPPCGTAPLWGALWVDAVATAWNDPARRRSLRSWDAVDALHPARALVPAGPLVPAAREHAGRVGWPELRSGAQPLDLPGTTPPDLAWFDDGSLARWALSALPPATEVAVDLAPLLEPEVGRRFLEAVLDLVRA